jgi:D-alanine-D-alanine ligase-like ATP-grasp enzyme
LRPHVVFNLVEHVGGYRTGDGVIAGILECAGLHYTGASARALMLSRDKHLSKIIVSAAGVPVPKSFVVRSLPVPANFVKFPAIVKPLNQDASEGIDARSYVTNSTQLALQVKRLIKTFGQPAICEEFVPGRELYVTASGIRRVTIDSICELIFSEEAPVKFATHRVKFDEQYRAKYKIRYQKSPVLSVLQRKNVQAASRAAYDALGIASYARLEFRLRGDDVFFFGSQSQFISLPVFKFDRLRGYRIQEIHRKNCAHGTEARETALTFLVKFPERDSKSMGERFGLQPISFGVKLAPAWHLCSSTIAVADSSRTRSAISRGQTGV